MLAKRRDVHFTMAGLRTAPLAESALRLVLVDGILVVAGAKVAFDPAYAHIVELNVTPPP